MAAPYQGPTETGLVPDRDCAWAFLSWWFKKCTLGLIEIGWMNPVTGGLTAFQRFALEDEAILDAIVAANRVPGQSIYVRACTIAPDTPAGKTTDLYIMQAPGGWGDLDTLAQVAHASLVAADAGVLIRPCGWVRTGRIPHDRFQLYLLASEPLVSGPLIRQVNRQFHALYGGDPAVVNPSRLMRMPGTIAWPYKPGREPELTSFGVFTDRPGAYPASTITAMLPQVNGEDHSPTALTHAGNGAAGAAGAGGIEWDAGQPATTLVGGISRESQLIGQITQGNGNWHNSVVELVAIWLNQGMSDAAIRLAAHAFRREPYTLSQTLREVQTAVDGGRRKWGIPAPAEPLHASITKNQILNLDELAELPDPSWLLHGIIPANSLVVPYGPPKAGKSFLLLSIGLHIAAGLPWFSRPVTYGAVVYIAGEGVGGLKYRVKAMLEAYGIQSLIPFFIMPRAVNFQVPAEVQALVAAIKDRIANSDFPHVPVVLVIIDTLARAMPGADENSAQDVGRVIAASDWLKEQLNCAVALVHHEGKDEGRGARGTSALRGAWDAAFRITKTPAQITMEVVDQKDAEAGAVLQFEMRDVPVGIGRSSLVPWITEGQADATGDATGDGTGGGTAGWAAQRPRRGRPPGKAGILMGVLERLSQGGEAVNGAVSIFTARREFYQLQPDLEDTSKQRAFRRSLDFLIQQNRVTARDEWLILI